MLAYIGCSNSTPAKSQPIGDSVDPNAVLDAGETFEFRNRNGVMKIHAGSHRDRTFTWDGATRSVLMEVRKERWYGALGLYFPGTGDHWKEHKGVTRGVLSEETRDFANLAEFETWLKNQQDWYDAKHTPDGLVAGWGINLERQQLNVEVHRITIAGKRQESLKGGTTDWLTWTKASD